MVRLFKHEISQDPNLSARKIMDSIKNLGICTRKNPSQHGSAVLRVLHAEITRTREVDMASLEGYVNLLRREGQEVEIISIKGMEMRNTRWK